MQWQLNFSSLSNSLWLGKCARVPLRLIPANAVLPVLQGPLRGLRWIAGSSNHGCWLGSYELPKQLQFTKFIKPGSVVYDLGANVGFYTLLAAVSVGGAGRVFAFEPLPENLAFLHKHLQLNGIENVTVVPSAVTSQVGTARFAPAPGRGMGHLHEAGELQVTTVTLDSIVRTCPPPQLIKIDIEGAELGVLQGASQMLAVHRPIIFLATHGRDLHGECCRLLIRGGYLLHGIGGQPPEATDELIAIPQETAGGTA
jgi:FkbM family methyltransferase